MSISSNSKGQPSDTTIWTTAAEVCVQNADRILEDAGYLVDYERFPSARALAILAQEEFAKAYLLKLVDSGALPICNEVLRACRDHSCKHLIALVMVHFFTPIDDLLERDKRFRQQADALLPRHVADALNLFCHEKLRRWRSKNWFWAEDPFYDPIALDISKGGLDRKKQDALYVGIGKQGLTSVPKCSATEAREAIETAKSLKEVAEGNDVFAFTERDFVITALRAMLEELREDVM